MKHMISVALATLALCSPAGAQEESDSLVEPELNAAAVHDMGEAAWDWRPGDLMFRDGINDIDEAMKRSFGLQWASVGILRSSSGGPRVAFVKQSDGVTEEMLYEHVEELSPDEYAVFLTGLSPSISGSRLMP